MLLALAAVNFHDRNELFQSRFNLFKDPVLRLRAIPGLVNSIVVDVQHLVVFEQVA